MKEQILQNLQCIESRHQVKVLYAVESGSRAWGLEAEGSDYDVRFIYIHQPNWYLSIDPQGVGKKREVIEFIEGINRLDMSGWEITKALRLYRKSNPALLEWLRSQVVYIQDEAFLKRIRTLEPGLFSPAASLHHYQNMAKRNYRMQLEKHSHYTVKGLFNILRPLLSCMWIIRHKEFPPNSYEEMLHTLISDTELKKEMQELVAQRISGFEGTGKSYKAIERFMETELGHIESTIASLHFKVDDPTEKLDELFRMTLSEAWD